MEEPEISKFQHIRECCQVWPGFCTGLGKRYNLLPRPPGLPLCTSGILGTSLHSISIPDARELADIYCFSCQHWMEMLRYCEHYLQDTRHLVNQDTWSHPKLGLDYGNIHNALRFFRSLKPNRQDSMHTRKWPEDQPKNVTICIGNQFPEYTIILLCMWCMWNTGMFFWCMYYGCKCLNVFGSAPLAYFLSLFSK